MRKEILVAALLLASSAAMAEPIVLDLPGAARMAAERSLELKAAQQDVSTARESVNEARGYSKGKIGLDAEYLRLNDDILITSSPVSLPSSLANVLGALGAQFGIEMPSSLAIEVPPVKVAPKDLIHLRLQAGYPLYTGGKIDYAVRGAESRVTAREALASASESDAVLVGTGYYLGAIFAREVVDVNKTALDTYKSHLGQAQKAYAAGIVAKYDVIRAETAVEEQKRKHTEAENRYQLAIAALKNVLVIDDAAEVELTDHLPTLSEEQSIEEAQSTALTQSPIIKALDAKIAALGYAEQYEKADAKPQVKAIAQAELLTGNIAQTDPEWTVGVQATLDLFDGGVKKARAAARHSEMEHARIERESAKDNIKLAIKSAYLDMDSAKSALQSSSKAVELAQESLRLAEKRLLVGTGTSLEVLDANTALSAAQVGMYQSMYQLDLAYLNLHRYISDISTVTQKETAS